MTGSGTVRRMTSLRRHLTYANIVATTALVLVMVGGGTAFALVVTGKQVKNRSLTGRDIKNSSVPSSKLNAAAHTLFTDTSPWERIPAGRTITGGFIYSSVAPAGVSDTYYDVINLPALARTDLTSSNVNVAANGAYAGVIGDADASCTGTVTSPTAPSGKVCIYILFTSATSNLIGNPWVPVNRSFTLSFADTDGGSVQTAGSWAYTAPA